MSVALMIESVHDSSQILGYVSKINRKQNPGTYGLMASDRICFKPTFKKLIRHFIR